jgi:hypothetical protein
MELCKVATPSLHDHQIFGRLLDYRGIHRIFGRGCLRRFLIDDAFRDLRQGRVGVLFFLQRRVEKPYGICKTQFICPGFQRPVAGYFVMLNRLGAGQKARIECR